MTSIKPLLTETTMKLAKSNWFTFSVPKEKSKTQLREIFEKIFNVKVIDIKTIVMKGKSKRSAKSRKTISAPDWKKALIKLKEGQKIDLFDIGA